MGTIAGLISTNVSSPSEAYETAQKLVRIAVRLEQIEMETKAAAIDSITRKGMFGSWILKLYKGHNVSVHLHLFVRLVEIVEKLAEKTGQEADRIEDMIADIKGDRDVGTCGAVRGRSKGAVRQSFSNSSGAS